MEDLSINVRREVVRYRRSRGGYQRLGGMGREDPAASTEWRLRRFRFRLRLKPRLKLLLRLSSAKKLFAWMRDAYVRMMLGFAESQLLGSGYGGDAAIDKFGRVPRKEYDQKVIIEVYRSLVMAQGQLVPRQAANLGAAVVDRP
ncbi:uncharacterized protein LOC116188856 [Punica granatum]|uniref:Uncharacterized protein LOC116188856 n=2 Tax=Punica granatum TaxID=22663 RepID=A0A6P8BTG7_PUNGR|nr:uncharacterized protein LOC116188856 [Punica granatum]PKI73935.1 hypothetical protein CRG98_005660 [Punica granatum]